MVEEFSYQFYRTTVEAWDAMYGAILAAQKSIYWEVYTLLDDIAGERFIDALCAKAAAGVEVKVIVDAVGSFALSNQAERRLRLSGAQVFWYNRLRLDWHVPAWLRRLWKRNHRKVLLIDEKIAFLGGVNIEAVAAHWYDLHLRVEGRVVRPLLAGFGRSFVRAGGEKKEVWRLLHPKLTDGLFQWKERLNFIIHSPQHAAQRSHLRKAYLGALQVAKESFNLLTPYYVPDKEFLGLISQARRRGVKVNIILPWRTDVKFMNYIASAFYGLTEKAGAALYFLRRMNHGKAFSVDNKIGLIGSANLTPRSFSINEETSAYFNDEQMVNDLNNILNNWKEEAMPLSEVGSSSRGWYKRLVSWAAYKFKDYV